MFIARYGGKQWLSRVRYFSSYPSALTTVKSILSSSKSVLTKSKGIQSSMLWILRTCNSQDLTEIMNGSVPRRIDSIPPFNKSPKPSPLLLQVFRLLSDNKDIYYNTLEVLSKDRLNELDLTSKCALVKALQMSNQSELDSFENEIVTRVLKSVDGDELTTMKNLLNDIGNQYNLHQLLFQALDNKNRATVLEHFQDQVKVMKHSKRPIKVLSDIDDTLFSSWLDTRWPRHVVYPGVRQFFIELTKNNTDNTLTSNESTHKEENIQILSQMIIQVEQLMQQQDETVVEVSVNEEKVKEIALVDRFRLLRENPLSPWINHEEVEVEDDSDIDFDAVHASSSISTVSTISATAATTTRATETEEPSPLEDITYITARPNGYRGLVAALTRRRLRLAGLSERPNVMLGDMSGILGNKRIAQKKFTNFAEFSLLFPEYDFVLAGDSGQGDAKMGQLMHEHYPSKLKGVFIHNINAKETTGDGRLKKEYEKELNFHFFQTYIGATTSAFQNDLMDKCSVINVSKSCVDEFLEKKFPRSLKGRQQFNDRLNDIYIDLNAAKEALLKVSR